MAITRPGQASFNRLQRSCESRIETAVSRLASGKLTAAQWADKMTDILTVKHAGAAALGRQRAGDLTAANADDTALGAAVAGEEGRYLARFQTDVEDGRYSNDDGALDGEKIGRRAKNYSAKLLGTANEAFVQASDPADTFDWHTGIVAEEHCQDCPDLRDGGPYTPATIPTYPRSGATECLFRCQCSLVRHDGETGFLPPDTAY